MVTDINELEIGDTVLLIEEDVEGIIRHLGTLKYDGKIHGNPYAIWSSWERQWDKILAPSGASTDKGNYLQYCDFSEVRLIKKAPTDWDK